MASGGAAVSRTEGVYWKMPPGCAQSRGRHRGRDDVGPGRDCAVIGVDRAPPNRRVTAGRVRISTRDSAGRELTLAIFGDGEFFGETGVLTGGPRTADATAEVDSGVLVLRKDEFDEYLAQNPAIMRTMLKVISQRQMV